MLMAPKGWHEAPVPKLPGYHGKGMMNGFGKLFYANNGEQSKQYSESALDGIVTVAPATGKVVRTEVFSINGTRQAGMTKGVNIVRSTHADGFVTTRKVIVK